MASVKRDYYEILSVTKSANGDEIKRSYRKLAVQFHPDKNPGDHTAEEKFKELGEAYEILMDENKRAAYDRYGHQAFAGGSAGPAAGGGGVHDPFDIFREVFGQQGGGGGAGGGIFEQIFGQTTGGGRPDRDGRQRGSDLRYDLQISLEEAALGVEKEIEIAKPDTCDTCTGTGAEPGSKVTTCSMCQGRGQVISSRGFFQVSQTCPKCSGTGRTIERPCKSCRGEGRVEKTSRIKLKIPGGIDDGARLRSSRNGEAGLRGGDPGDLYVVIHVKEHPVFQRDDDNLYCELPISFTTAALGGELQAPTLEGKANLKIPAGTQNGTRFRLREKGIQGLNARIRGDLIVQVLVEVPTKLNSEQKDKLEAFAAACGDENSPLHKSFFDKAREFFR